MPRYHYIAKDFGGNMKSGSLEAENESALTQALRDKGYFLIKADTGAVSQKRKGGGISLPFFNRISLVEKLMFVNNLQLMVSAGVSLPRTLNILSEQTKNKEFKRIIGEISEKITKGKSLSESLEDYPSVFPELFSSMIKVGEEGGTLEKVLDILAKQMEKEYDLKSKLRNAMLYPVILVSFMGITGIVMIIIVVPKFAEIFAGFGLPLPLTTKMLIWGGSFLASYWYLLPIFVLVLFFSLRFILRTRLGKSCWGKWSLKIPLVGKIVKKANAAYMARTLSSLIASGVPIVMSLTVVSNTMGNIHYRKALAESAKRIEKGSNLAESLEEYGNLYPPLVIQIVRIGEETGKTSTVLEKVAEFFEKEVDSATKNFSAVIEPFLIVFVGFCVGFFALSIIQPLYSILGTV